MTSTVAPTDLLNLRSVIQSRTGLTADELGIVGNAQHIATGGYHEGRSDLEAAGRLGSDYSDRLTRDRDGLTESASAMDIGSRWASGRDAWMRFSALLAAHLISGDPDLSAVRAINYTSDHLGKVRIDREEGWKVEPSSDTDHTHVEWYRDTEGKRQASLDAIAALVSTAVNGTSPVPVAAGPVLVVDGELGPLTITAWQRRMGTTPDGVITQPPGRSELVRAVQSYLNANGARDARDLSLVLDGVGICQGGPRYHTTEALQRYLGTPVDGVLSAPISEAVMALQRRLNAGSF